jgi:hypothetical protein
MTTIPHKQYKIRTHLSERLIALETMAAAAKAALAQGRDDGHFVTGASCEFAFESDVFPSQFAHIAQTGDS